MDSLKLISKLSVVVLLLITSEVLLAQSPQHINESWFPYSDGSVWLTGRQDIGPNGHIIFRTSGKTYREHMLINGTTGQVTIGNVNVSPGSCLLAVNGKIGAREVVVTLSSPFPDYVFENTYNLRPLTEVASYIKENKHLPEIPSAKEVEANGINLGEMDALLLKKIEELTLYMIEIKKENELMKKEIETLKSK